MIKRIVTLALALIMCLSLAPLAVNAAQPEAIPPITVSFPFAKGLELTLTNVSGDMYSAFSTYFKGPTYAVFISSKTEFTANILTSYGCGIEKTRPEDKWRFTFDPKEQFNPANIGGYSFQIIRMLVHQNGEIVNQLNKEHGGEGDDYDGSEPLISVDFINADYISLKKYAEMNGAPVDVYTKQSLRDLDVNKAPASASASVYTRTVDAVLDKIIKPGMTTDEQIKTCYDFLIYQFVHTGQSATPNSNQITMPSAEPVSDRILTGFFSDDILGSNSDISGTFFEVGNFMYDAYHLFATSESGCKGFSYALYSFLNRLGIECELWYGNYYNASTGSKLVHAWNRVKIDGQWYWYDVDVEGTIYRRDAGKILYSLYRKDTGEFNKTHTDGELFFSQRTAFYAKTPSSAPSAWAVAGVNTAVSRGLATPPLNHDYQSSTTRLEFCSAAVNFLEKYYGKTIDTILSERGLTRLTFSDTTDASIGAAAALKITNGTDIPNKLFSPNLPLTREQAATMLRNVMNVIGADTTPPPGVLWTDAKDISDWAQTAADVMYSAKVMGGTSSTALVFEPKSPYTHEQSIATLVNLWDYVKK